ncbi:FAD-dependent oxidoreductase [Bacillus cereus]|uniref:FAD-dependent oxidoreductase n=3 Tax=Bacillus thuringiensis TaxID=1428 RepID=A0AAP4Q5Q7_BACTU|nr:FAD-dependent oxidoreductase [Bacillus thuringiensis]ERH97642.1 Dihydrolipoyl dehydrogenase [Bacillus thuringiensis T01-328]MEC2879053.1 FAD-dependent oxidoreductase [Bacillus cereus]AGG05371.1 Dihydrolipoamide dehydrogenase of pyruvate dehydrogenase complex [Bacillus thuringiensis serovar thuringiensis str. IS5056]ARP61408.1 dihydrolipoyl dehydrogenase [Bacillus thuringiensis]EEM31605.1 Dihydrolipoyl dehydrogenase [Bacillus thuringiensis serovar thuringiensis str. T01001]
MNANQLRSAETIVIGGGPGGYVTAIRAAQLGRKVMIVEKEHLGGVCLNVGCIPSKALITANHHFHQVQSLNAFGNSVHKVEVDFSKVQAFKDGVVKKLTGGVEMMLKGNKVEIVKGTATFVDGNTVKVSSSEGEQTIRFQNAIMATGSCPVENCLL